MPKERKDVLWGKILEVFEFLKDLEGFARRSTMSHFGRCLRTWWGELNRKYVQKGKDGRKEYRRIPDAVWKEFVEQHMTEEAKALSLKMTEKSLKAAQNPHYCLGAGGYEHKIPQWRKEKEERNAAGVSDILYGLDERSRNWVLA